jgi:hypothetical protein
VTGEYTLADGRVGNMYKGPYPTNTMAVATGTQTESEGPVTATVSLPIGSSGTVPLVTVTAQQGASSKAGE